MENYLSLLSKNPLFASIDESNLLSTLSCLSPKVKTFSKEEYIYIMGDHIDTVGILLEGEISILKEDIYGNRHILAHINPGNMFAEAFVCAGINEIPVSVKSNMDCKVLFIDIDRIMTSCHKSCMAHNTIIFNMLKIVARKNVHLNEKISYLSASTTRDKISMYLVNCLTPTSGKTITIPFSRNELAEYLGVNRSVLSRELSSMKKEGLITFNKNTFTIIGTLEF